MINHRKASYAYYILCSTKHFIYTWACVAPASINYPRSGSQPQPPRLPVLSTMLLSASYMSSLRDLCPVTQLVNSRLEKGDDPTQMSCAATDLDAQKHCWSQPLRITEPTYRSICSNLDASIGWLSTYRPLTYSSAKENNVQNSMQAATTTSWLSLDANYLLLSSNEWSVFPFRSSDLKAASL